MVLLQVAILRKAFKLIQLLQFPISLLLGVFTDACVFAVSIIPVELYVIRLLLVIFGVLALALGVVCMMLSDTVMNVGEALVKVLSDVFKKENITILRIGLQTTDNVNKDTVIGPYHSAFAELCYSEYYKKNYNLLQSMFAY